MTAYYNEFDPKAAAWLRELISRGLIAPGVVDERSIEDVIPADLAGFTQCHFFAGIGVWSYALRRAGWPDDRPVWTGSCPCQPFSAAGKGAGFDDERHLWPAWQWLIGQCRPPVVFGEQVASKDADAWVDLVSLDLEALGYAVGAVPFPSAGIGAPHIRDRTYWVADDDDARLEGRRQPGRERAAERLAGAGSVVGRLADADNGGEGAQLGDHREVGLEAVGRTWANNSASVSLRASAASRLADADGGNPSAERQQRGGEQRQQQEDGGTGGVADADGRQRNGLPVLRGPERDGQDTGRTEGGGELGPRSFIGGAGPVNGLWRDADWLFCRDGKWRPVEPGTFPLVARAPARVVRLRGYGNAINAEAAKTFIEAYLETQHLRLTSGFTDYNNGILS